MLDSEKLCGIYEMKEGAPTKLRVKNLVFELNPGFTVLEIIDRTLTFTDLIDFDRPVTLAQEETIQEKPLQKIIISTPGEVEVEQMDNMLDLVHNTTIYQSAITALHSDYADACFTGLEIEATLKRLYPHLSATTMRSRRSAYTQYLLKNSYIKAISKSRYKAVFEFIKIPEWISGQTDNNTEETSQKEEICIEV